MVNQQLMKKKQRSFQCLKAGQTQQSVICHIAFERGKMFVVLVLFRRLNQTRTIH